MSDWINLGDVNFIQYGGCLVKRHFSDEEIARCPDLKRIYDVLFVTTDAGDNGEDIVASLHCIDVSDYEDAEKKESILYGIGKEELKDLPMNRIMDDELWAKEIVEAGGTESSSYRCQYPADYSDYVISEAELIEWMIELGAEEFTK